MAVGITSDAVSTRADIIAAALRKVKAWPEDNNPPLNVMLNAVKTLNRVLRQEDLKGVQQNKHLWALDDDEVILIAEQYIYDSGDGLPTGILDLISAVFRDTSGDDIPLEIITSQEYAEIANKNDTGDPAKIYLKRDRLIASQALYVWPTRTSIGTTSVATGSDAKDYSCIQKHNSTAINKPITGADWELYWKLEGSGGSAWATDTDYTNSHLIRLTFKRPLFDFDGVYDNPDFPPGWDQYLIYKLAVDLATESTLSVEERGWLVRQLLTAEKELFPSSRANANTHHNQSEFF